MSLRGMATEGQHKGHCLLGSRHAVGVRRVHDDDPVHGGGAHVDVIDAHAGAPYDTQPRSCFEHLGIHLRAAAYDQGIVVADGGKERFSGEIRTMVILDVRGLIQPFADRQQQVILGIRNRVMSSNALPRLVGRAPALYESFSSGVHTNMSLDQAIRLAWLAQEIPEENIKRGVIGTEHILLATSPEGDQVLKPRPQAIRILRDEICTADGPVSPVMASADPQELMQSENASLAVFNGSGTPGLATRTADYLATEGANIATTGDAPEAYSETTLISYTGNPYTVKYLVEHMGISSNRIYLRYDPTSQVDMVVYLGYDWANNNPMP